MKHTIRRINPLSAAKIAAVIYGFMGVVFGLFFFLGSRMMSVDRSMVGPFTGIELAAPLIYAALGALFTLVSAVIYNLVAGWVGGVELEIDID
jgi:hypothetical protein